MYVNFFRYLIELSMILDYDLVGNSSKIQSWIRVRQSSSYTLFIGFKTLADPESKVMASNSRLSANSSKKSLLQLGNECR